MRDHNYHSRMKNCHVRFKLTVDNENLLCEKKKLSFEIIDWFFSELVSHILSYIIAGTRLFCYIKVKHFASYLITYYNMRFVSVS